MATLVRGPNTVLALSVPLNLDAKIHWNSRVEITINDSSLENLIVRLSLRNNKTLMMTLKQLISL